MKKDIIFAAVASSVAVLALTACGTDSSTGAASAPDASSQIPAPPALGSQIDRSGRPVGNAFLNHTFDPNPVTPGAAKDAYNADSVPAHWATYAPAIKASLAIYDGLDTVCGNQVAFGALAQPDYTTLANILVADFLWLNTASTTCQAYLSVELNALGRTNTDCGGRTLTENVVDVTYNALTGTSPANATTNGITAPSSAPSTTFPYLATPH